MYDEIILNFANGMQIITWKTGSEVYMGIVNVNGFVVTDRKLTIEEADTLHSVAHCP